MAEMPEVLMPDQSSPFYPAAFRFPPAVERYYHSLPRTLRRNWDLFGPGSTVDARPPTTVRGVEGTERARIKTYAAQSAQLDRKYLELQKMDSRLRDQLRKSLARAQQGQAELENAIHRVNGEASTVPVGMSKGQHILGYLSAGLDRVDHIIENTTKSLSVQVSAIGRLTQHASTLSLPVNTTPIMSQPPSTITASNRPPAPEEVRAPGEAGVRSSGDPADEMTDPHNTTDGRTPTSSRSTGPAATATAESSPSSTDSESSSPISAPGATAEAAGQSSRALSSAGRETGPSPGGDSAGSPPSAQAAKAGALHRRRAAGSPWAGQPEISSAAKRDKSKRSRSSLRGVTETTVTYTFPDGRRQDVSPMVARALDAAFDNRLGTDARSAYATSPEDTSGNGSGNLRCTPDSVATGDVAVWSRRSALLVVFGSGGDRTLELIVEGRLVPHSARMSDSRGEFGSFAGFHRPQRAAPTTAESHTGHPWAGRRRAGNAPGGDGARAASDLEASPANDPGNVPSPVPR